MTVAVVALAFGRHRVDTHAAGDGHFLDGLSAASGQAAQAEAHFGSRAGLARIAAAENDVLHLVAAQALGALLAKHPRDGVGDVALAAAVGADDGGDALVEGKLRAIGEGFESGDSRRSRRIT